MVSIGIFLLTVDAAPALHPHTTDTTAKLEGPNLNAATRSPPRPSKLTSKRHYRQRKVPCPAAVALHYHELPFRLF